MYRREEFREWFSATGKAQNTVATHISILNGADAVFDLDRRLGELGTDKFLEWAKQESTGPFEKYPANTRSALNRYVEFTIAAGSADAVEDIIEEEPTPPLLFQLEKEMQIAVRKQLDELEKGLKVADDGRETVVATGKIDIVARDSMGKLVVIELKAGLCPAGALEQVLGYADALAEERNEEVRAYLIAGSFSDRTRSAARRTTGLELRTYEFSVRFNSPSAK